MVEGAEDGRNDALRGRADPGAVAAPDFSVHHGGSDGLLATPVRGVDARMPQVGKQLVEMGFEKLREAFVGDVRFERPD